MDRLYLTDVQKIILLLYHIIDLYCIILHFNTVYSFQFVFFNFFIFLHLFFYFNTEAALKQCRNIARQYSYFNKIFQNTNNTVSAILKDVFTYERYW